MKTPGLNFASRRRSRRGSIYVVAMWVVLVLGALVLFFSRSTQVEVVSAGNRMSNVKAAAIEHAAEQYVLCQVDGTLGDAPSIMAIPGQAIQVGDGYFWLLRFNPAANLTGTPEQQFDFGIQDEASKININAVTDAQAVNLPNATQGIADSIVTWRNANGTPTGEATGSGFYEGLQPEPYENKSGPFETVEELLLLQNADSDAQVITKDILFGSDLNRNGVIDPGEGQAATGTGQAAMALSNNNGYNDARGMYNFLTCYTVEPSTDPNGNAKVNVTDRNGLQNLLTQQGMSTQRIEQVLSQVAPTGIQRRFTNLGQWYQASGLQPNEFGPIAAFLTASAAPAGGGGGGASVSSSGTVTATSGSGASASGTSSSGSSLTGLVNINTASQQALLTLGLQESDAQTIVASQSANSGGVAGTSGSGLTMGSTNATPPSYDLTWLLQAVSKDVVVSLLPYITYRSFFYSADIVAVSGDGRSFRRVRIVVDARSSPPLIVYRKDLTGYGWPLTPEIHQAMRNGQAPPILQTVGATNGGSGL